MMMISQQKFVVVVTINVQLSQELTRFTLMHFINAKMTVVA